VGDWIVDKLKGSLEAGSWKLEAGSWKLINFVLHVSGVKHRAIKKGPLFSEPFF